MLELYIPRLRIGAAGSKRPSASWKRWRENPTPVEQLRVARARGKNLLCCTGDLNGLSLIVFDSDEEGADAALVEFVGHDFGWVTDSPRQPIGGTHRHTFTTTLGLRSCNIELSSGHKIEAKANGSLVAMPGNLHPNGSRYTRRGEWAGEPPETPAALLELVKHHSTPSSARVTPNLPHGAGVFSLPPSVYAPALIGSEIDSSGNVRCPNHNDEIGSMTLYPDFVFCGVCRVGTRIRGLAGMVLGIGHAEQGKWGLTPDEKDVVDERLRALFPEAV